MSTLVDVVLSYTRRSLVAVLLPELKEVQLDELVRNCVHDLAGTNPDRQIVISAAGNLQVIWDALRDNPRDLGCCDRDAVRSTSATHAARVSDSAT